MVCGFQKAGYESGVPMIPKPKSEAWLLCAVKSTPYQHCDKLENESGNDNSPNSLKKQLAKVVNQGKSLSVEEQLELFDKYQIDVSKIQMPSFLKFRERLEDVLKKVLNESLDFGV